MSEVLPGLGGCQWEPESGRDTIPVDVWWAAGDVASRRAGEKGGRMTIQLAIFVFLAIAGQTDTPPTASATSRTTTAQATEKPVPVLISNLISDLSSTDSQVRESSTVALMEMGPECYGPLREAFTSTRLYDVRRRIRQVALELYLTEHLGPPKAFLGISHRGTPVMEASDGRVPPWATALYVTDVFKSSSAQRAGLQSGDLVLALNGKPGTLEYQAIEFTRWIGDQAPGTRCEVMVIRGGKGHKLVPDPRGQFNPKSLAPAKFEAVDHARDGRVPPGVGGILLKSVKGIPVELNVQDGDLILALDEEAIPAEGTEQRFGDWLEGKWKGRGMSRQAPIRLGGAQLQRPPQQAGDHTVQTAHLLRGGEGIDLTVALGRWPTYLSDQAQGAPRAANPGQREHVIETFGSWWRETFDPKGLFSERADLDPRWRLGPGLQAH